MSAAKFGWMNWSEKFIWPDSMRTSRMRIGQPVSTRISRGGGAAGFGEVQTWLEESPIIPPEPETYLRVVCLGPHLEALPEDLRERYTRDVLARCGEPVELDYVRLNILARA